MAVAVGTSARRIAAAHLGSRNVTRVLYGAIVGLAVVVVLEQHPPAVGEAIAAILGTAIAVGLAELYSEAVGEETRTHRRLGAARIRGLAGEAAAVAFGAGFPAVFFIAAAAGAIELDTAFGLSKWGGLGLISAYGLIGARYAGSSWPRAIVQAAAVGAIGAFLIALKALVH